jgi:MIP family channel proteins
MKSNTGSQQDAEKIVALPKRVATEFIGTFMLVLAAAGADVADAVGGHELGKLAVIAAPGFVLTAMIYATDKISGAYFNPAVSIGFAVTRHLKFRDLPFYIAAQVAGAIVAAIAVAFAIGHSGTAGLTIPHMGEAQAFAMELVSAFLLMFVGISVKEQVGYKAFGGIAIGAVIIATGIVGMGVSGASMNPARSLGPAIVACNFTGQWIYWVAPILGAAIAVFFFKAIKGV